MYYYGSMGTIGVAIFDYSTLVALFYNTDYWYTDTKFDILSQYKNCFSPTTIRTRPSCNFGNRCFQDFFLSLGRRHFQTYDIQSRDASKCRWIYNFFLSGCGGRVVSSSTPVDVFKERNSDKFLLKFSLGASFQFFVVWRQNKLGWISLMRWE